MPSLISHLGKIDQQTLLEDLNYLNMGEIKVFCKEHSIPYTIWIETEKGRRKTSEDDRKGVILNRIRHYLKTGNILEPTCFSAGVVCFDAFSKNPKETDQLFYGQYNKKNTAMFALLKKLTNGEFKDGAIARILMNEFWRKGVAPTYLDYAAAWLNARENHKRPNPEWAFLSDRTDRKEIKNWKQLRTKKAKQVLRVLRTIEPKETTGLPAACEIATIRESGQDGVYGLETTT